MSNSPALLLDVREAARQLGISRAAIQRLISSGDIASVKIGARRLIPVHAVEEFVAVLVAEA